MSPSQSLPNTELEVLRELWDQPGASVRELHERLTEAGKEWAYNTVQTLLNRLCDKGYAEAVREGRALAYTALVSREELVRDELAGIADKMCEGSSTPLVLSLFEGRSFSANDLREFRRLLDELETGARRKKRTKKKGGRR